MSVPSPRRSPAPLEARAAAGVPSGRSRSASPRRTRHLHPAASLAIAAALALPAALLAAPTAQAHDSLASSSPAAGATVTAVPRAITLTFDEPVLDYPDTTALIVTGPGAAKRHFETACPRIDRGTVTAPVALGASGRYTVTWRVVSDDGHPVSDTFEFTLDRPAGTDAAAGSASGPACGAGTASGSAGASSSGTLPPVVWVIVGGGGGLVVILLLVVVLLAVRLSRRPTRAREESGSGPA